MSYWSSSRLFLPVITALLLFVAFPGGGNIAPLVFVALVPVLIATCPADRKGAFLAGLTAGVVHYVLLMYWLVIVLSKYGGLNWFFSLQGLLFLSLYMGLYFALFTFLARGVVAFFPAAVSLWLLPVIWVGIDWFRGVFLTGLPWMDLGYSLYENIFLVQIADLFGHHGLSFLIVFVNVLLYLLFARRQSFFSIVMLLLPAAALFTATILYSQNRLNEVSQLTATESAERITVGVVQGNIDQSVKWSKKTQKSTVEKYLELTRTLFGISGPDMVIWPETALPFYPLSNGHMGSLKKLVHEQDSALLTGAPWYEIVDRKAKKVKFFNSAFLLNPTEKIGGIYYKTHLVPFGEYVPFKKFLPFLAPLVEAVGDFSPGVIEKPLAYKDAKAGVLICFESVFPELSRDWVKAGANVLFNLTNDAWYGRSSAPHHSLAMSVLRAVETRRSLVRSANTGISAFVGPDGKIEAQSDIFEPWAKSREVILLTEQTFWVRWGYLAGAVCFGLTLIISLITLVRRQ